MFDSPFLKDAANSRNERQQLDHLLQIAAPHERAVLVGIGAVMLSLVSWALLGSIVRTVTINGVLIKPGDRHDIVSTEPGHLVEYLVDVGDRVEAGDPIARQSVPELDREARVLRDQADFIQSEALESGEGGSALRSRLASFRSAMLQLEARRSTRELLVSHVAGEVTALWLNHGDFMPAGTTVAQLGTANGNSFQAVAQVGPQLAQRVGAGMRASVEVAMPNGGTRRLSAEVARVTLGTPPKWLAADFAPIEGAAHRVEADLLSEPDLPNVDRAACRIRIVLGRYRPVSLLGLSQPR